MAFDLISQFWLEAIQAAHGSIWRCIPLSLNTPSLGENVPYLRILQIFSI
jgi:hypothetical protein